MHLTFMRTSLHVHAIDFACTYMGIVSNHGAYFSMARITPKFFLRKLLNS